MHCRLGVVGAGSFSMFSAAAFLENPGISIEGIYDIDPARGEAFASKYSARHFDSMARLLGDEKIDLIYISTPPNLHYGQSKAALVAGKHVICEKPAALEPSHAEELYSLAGEKGLLYVVNLMQRYNPLYRKVMELIRSGLLGRFLHGYFENYASDENLHPRHWMWNSAISGGIFIEHAVHFFDMFDGWLGEGKLVSSQKVCRPGFAGIYSRVQSVGLYSGGLVNLYHGFDQPSRMDRQEIRLLFEKGDVTLHEWVPVSMDIIALVTTEEELQLMKFFPEATVHELERYEGEKRLCRGNFRDFSTDKKIRMEYGKGAKKEDIYRLILREMIADQVEWIHDHSHQRIITGMNGVNSLKMAWEAERNAQLIG